jgi:hypothetical protein
LEKFTLEEQGSDVMHKYIYTDKFRNAASSGVINKDIIIEAKQEVEVKYFSFKNLKLHYINEELVLKV